MSTKNKDNRHFYNSYIVCYCSRHQTIQLGWKLYGYASIFVGYPLAIAIVLGVILTFPRQNFGVVLVMLSVGLLAGLNYIGGYRELYKKMIAAGHTKSCSNKVSRRGSPFLGIYSEFKILNKEDDK